MCTVTYFITRKFPWIITLNIWVFFYCTCFSSRNSTEHIRDVLPLFFMYIISITLFMVSLSLNVSSNRVFILWLFIPYISAHLSCFSLTLHVTSGFLYFCFVVFIRQGHCFIEYILALIHGKLLARGFYLLVSILQLLVSFVALSHIFFKSDLSINAFFKNFIIELVTLSQTGYL